MGLTDNNYSANAVPNPPQVRRKGDTVLLYRPPAVTAWAAAAGKKEAAGPLAAGFDRLEKDTHAGLPCWEAAESRYQQWAFDAMLEKAQLSETEIDAVFSGDLENQCTASSYHLRQRNVPFVGLYGACSTLAEGLGLAGCFVGSGMAKRAVAMASSHFCTAERQFRTPLEYGGQRTPTAQWTATCAGAVLLESGGDAPAYLHGVTFGRVQDLGVTDINNMGAAMAPAAADTITRFLTDTATRPEEYDGIFTGDLGLVGSRLLKELLQMRGITLKNHCDCGLMLYDLKSQQVGVGGSGAGCSAGVLCSRLLPLMEQKRLNRILLVATGALMSQITWQQGESIPAVAHLVELRSGREKTEKEQKT